MKRILIFLLVLAPVIVFSQKKIIAHRGASSICPENTLAAFEKAIEVGAGYIELDLQLSKDDSIMIIHDETLNRTTSGSGNVNQFSYHELKGLSAGYSSKFNDDFSSEKIPTLYEILNLAKGKVKVCIDIKNTPEQPVLDLIDKLDLRNQVFLMSYNVEKLERIKSVDPQIRTVLQKNTLEKIDLEIAKETDVYAVATSYISPLCLVDKAHNTGIEYWVGIPNDPAKVERLLNRNVDAVFTDYPQLMTMSSQDDAIVYPNPFSEKVTITFVNPENIQEVKILNREGAILRIFYGSFGKTIYWEPNKNIAKGFYLVYIIRDERTTFEKILYY